MMLKTLTRLLALSFASLALALAGCGGDDLPYTVEEMEDAQYRCQVHILAEAMSGRTVEEVDCLRPMLPELSDDQLNRLDHLIEQAEEEESK